MNETLIRSLSGLVFISVLLFATLFSPESYLLLFGLCLLQTAREFCDLIQLPKLPALLVSGVLYVLFAVFPTSSDFIDFGLVFASLVVLTRLIFWLFSNKNTGNDRQAKWVRLIGYIILPFILIVKIPMLTTDYVPSIIIGIFILIWTNDTFAYVVGKSIGKNKLLERISPKKTIEGFLGGLAFALLAGVLIALFYVQEPVYVWVITAICVSFLGTIGDLVESKFKRAANVKDSGNIMPGHGGMLDRLDSIIFVAPFLFLFYKILVYVS
ncbi:phosphatidate cytidylyltransferase [Flavobacterium humi]|uniref:Phosphatidate cytidylyltransferase n=1 Tax=Flavobacterium humi TaxID=2562683 RepID=A0A4Z0L7S7_9FLAO|nr:phosphatidate cytidylyltransferase [Flavobacterium humi]TGD58281.1 phosphatidate cytidylyltransferase [Flavobacterium humi]